MRLFTDDFHRATTTLFEPPKRQMSALVSLDINTPDNGNIEFSSINILFDHFSQFLYIFLFCK